jgi:hypothetical protein
MEQPSKEVRLHVTEVLGPAEDAYGIEDLDRDRYDDLEFSPADCNPSELVQINKENPDEAKAILKIIDEFKDIFAIEVRPTPADVPPFVLVVDETKWKRVGKKTGPRPTSLEKQVVIKEVIEQLVRTKVIQRSQALPYSDLHLVPKPPGSVPPWRATMDYRVLNELCEAMGWPLPKIREVFARIGQAKPRYFAIMDMTSGYHQIAMSVDSRAFTAFVTFMGVYEWLRLPMGLKAACSFFQSTMASVFGVALYKCVEIYLDDMIVYAKTFEEFVKALRTVFECARAKKLTLNPKKCKFLWTEFNALGLTLTAEGVKMQEEKIKKLLDFPIPLQGKQLKSFLGLANYFRDFVKNYSMLVTPHE